MRKQFCSYCGRQLVDGYTISTKSMEKGSKQLTAMHLCAGHFRTLERLKFCPVFKFTRKMKKWPLCKVMYSTKVDGKRVKRLLYTIPSWNLKEVMELNKESPVQKRFTSDGTVRIWTEEQVRSQIESSNQFAIRCTQLLYAKQTEVEKKDYKTKFSNGNGFNKSDAKFGSAMARKAFDKGNDSLTEVQLVALRKLLSKYCNQLTQLLFEDDCLQNNVNKDGFLK